MSSFTGNEKIGRRKGCPLSRIYSSYGKKLVILEFGIGWRNQMIKAPFDAASSSRTTGKIYHI